MRLIDVDEYIKEINKRIVAEYIKGINKRIKEAFKWYDECRTDETKIRAEQAIATFREASLTAKKMPTFEAEPIRHGKWIYTGFMEVKCSNCGNVFHELEDLNYCPNCGYQMDDVVWGEE